MFFISVKFLPYVFVSFFLALVRASPNFNINKRIYIYYNRKHPIKSRDFSNYIRLFFVFQGIFGIIYKKDKNGQKLTVFIVVFEHQTCPYSLSRLFRTYSVRFFTVR